MIEKFLTWLGDKLFAIRANKLYLRLDRLYTYIQNYDLNTLEKITLTKKIGQYYTTYIIEFKSELGPVQVELFWNDPYVLTYSDYAGAKVFTIMARYSTAQIQPLLGEDLMAKDIDLALHELEYYIENELGDVDKKLKAEWEEENRKKALHEKEMKKLI